MINITAQRGQKKKYPEYKFKFQVKKRFFRLFQYKNTKISHLVNFALLNDCVTSRFFIMDLIRKRAV